MLDGTQNSEADDDDDDEDDGDDAVEDIEEEGEEEIEEFDSVAPSASDKKADLQTAESLLLEYAQKNSLNASQLRNFVSDYNAYLHTCTT